MFPPPPPRSLPLELSGTDLQAVMGPVLERVATHIDTLATQPAQHVDRAEETARSLIAPISEDGEDLEDVLSLLFDRCAH